MNKASVASLFSSTALVAALCAHPSFAQSSGAPNASSTSGTTIGEVVVTATRQAQQLSKVPVSVAAYTQQTLDKQDVKTFQDVANLTPGITFSPGFRGNTSASSLAIRGITTNGGTATVGVYIDETPVQIRPDGYQSSNPYPRIFDLDRVEVLRGPQGTLFGAGSEGGTVRFISPEPSTHAYSAYGRAELAFTDGGDPTSELGAAVGGPIINDTLGFRVSADYRREGGYVSRVNWYDGRILDSKSNWNDAATARIAFKWTPNSDLEISPSFFYQNTYINDSSNYWEAFSNASKGKFNNGNPLQTPTHDQFYLPALKIQYDFGSARLVSNTSYLDRDKHDTYDSTTLDMASFAGIKTAQPPAALQDAYAPGYLYDKQHVFTQEVRLQNNDSKSRFNWVVGVFYQHTNQQSLYNVQDTFVNQFLLYSTGLPITVQQIFGFPLYNGVDLLASSQNLTNDELSAYTQEDFNVTDKLKLTAGVRISSESYSSAAFSAGPVVSSNGSVSTVSSKDHPVTPKFGISYQADPNDLFYFSAAKGFRQGSATAALGSRCAADAAALGLSITGQRQITPDYVWSYELGSKNRLADGKLQIDTSVFHIDWNNIQTAITLPNCNIPTTINAGTAVSQGFDTQIQFKPVDALALGASVGYTDAHFTSTTRGAGTAIIRSSGQPLGAAPWTVALSGQYDFMFVSHDSYARLDYQYASHDSTALDYASAATDPTIQRPPATNNVNARLGMKVDRFDVSVFGANLTNQHPELTRYRDTLTTFVYRGQTVQPLTIGVTALYRY